MSYRKFPRLLGLFLSGRSRPGVVEVLLSNLILSKYQSYDHVHLHRYRPDGILFQSTANLLFSQNIQMRLSFQFHMQYIKCSV